jgi:hypothetical protein
LTKSFAEHYGDIPIRHVGDEFVAGWLAGGGRAGSVRGLCHFAGWYMVNELEMSSEGRCFALGHQDGGNLVRRLYGHRDKGRALDRIVGAYATRAENRRTRSRSS